MRRALFLLAGALFFVPAHGYAQERGEDSQRSAAERAEEHSRLGVEYYEAGRLPEAVREMMAAYEAIPDATLLYNIARIYQKMEQPDLAVVYFKRFVAHEGADPDTVQSALEHMEPLADGKPAKARMAAPVAALAEDEPSPERKHPAPWISGSLAAASLVALGVSGALALDNKSTAQDTSQPWDDRAAAKELSDELGIVADISLGVAVAATVTTVVLAVATRNKSIPVVLVPVGPRGGPGLALSLRFGTPARRSR